MPAGFTKLRERVARAAEFKELGGGVEMKGCSRVA